MYLLVFTITITNHKHKQHNKCLPIEAHMPSGNLQLYALNLNPDITKPNFILATTPRIVRRDFDVRLI